MLAPEIQEHAGPGGRVVFPELLKIFFAEIGTDGPEVVAEQIWQTELLLRGEILFAATLLCARKLTETIESDKPNLAKQYFVDGAIQEAEFVLERIDKKWP